MRRLKPLILALALALLAAPPAAAAAIDLGHGMEPSIVVDPAGTAHILFIAGTNVDAGAVYCRLPRGATACDVRIDLPSSLLRDVRILRRDSDGALIALLTDEATDATGKGTVRASSSFDGGATFTPQAALQHPYDLTPAALSADGQAFFALGLEGGVLSLARTPFAAPDPRVLAVDDRADVSATNPRATVLADGRMLVAQKSGDTTGWRFFSGGDPFDLNNWRRRGVLRNVNLADLTSGRRGLFLLDDPGLLDEYKGRAPLYLRSFDTKRQRWRSRRGLFADRAPTDFERLVEDGSGRLHVAAAIKYPQKSCVLYARTGPKASSWFGRTTVIASNTGDLFDLTLSSAADGGGFATWYDRVNLAVNHVWAAPLKQSKGKYRPRRPLSRLGSRLAC